MEKINTLINGTNIKLTTARKAILEILSTSIKPLCYEDMKDKISMDKATFYRNITKFEEENIINSFESNDKKRYFEIQKNQHAHFICTKCTQVSCLNEDSNIYLQGYQIDNVIIKGICPNCLI